MAVSALLAATSLMASPTTAEFVPSPLLRRFRDVCVHVAYKGSMSRQGYAWFVDESTALPDPPLLSRHVEFLPSARALAQLTPWWRPADVNKTVTTNFKFIYTTSASNLTEAPVRIQRGIGVRWLRNASWFIDVSHGGTPNLWSNICHFSNSMFPMFEAAHLGQACERNLAQVLMWQVPRETPRLTNSSYHGGVLGTVLHELAKRRLASGASYVAPAPDFLFDEDMPAGGTLCFEELIVYREPNLSHHKLQMQSRASMTNAGVARGFSLPQVRDAFRRALLSHLRLPAPEIRVPTITYLSRPMKEDAKTHGNAWQLRCHLSTNTFKQLRKIVLNEAGFRMNRVIFEKTTYLYQAKVMSESDIFWAAHGAGMVHLPLLPARAVVIEMFNCGHFSYLYANMAKNLRLKYFAMQRTEPYCYRPPTMAGHTRRNLTKTYAYTIEEAEPVLMQAVRYAMWQDLGPTVNGRESRCELAAKVLKLTGALPLELRPAMTVHRFTSECLPGLNGSDPEATAFRKEYWRAWVPGMGHAKLQNTGGYSTWNG